MCEIPGGGASSGRARPRAHGTGRSWWQPPPPGTPGAGGGVSTRLGQGRHLGGVGANGSVPGLPGAVLGHGDGEPPLLLPHAAQVLQSAGHRGAEH